jgi:farnesyl diphosphate synthase
MSLLTSVAVPQDHKLAALDFSQWRSDIVERIEGVLQHLLPAESAAGSEPLHQAMRYAVLGGGKRIRALLVHAAGQLNQAPIERLDVAAASLEMMHAYSLVHDDLPCMDDDDLRRGKPTVHKAFGDALAVLAGDALQTQAFLCLSAISCDAERRVQLINELASAAGSLGMAGGQALDLNNTGSALARTELENMHQMKTGALIRAALRMGLICGAGLPINLLDDYAIAIGLAFQVVDDILDTQNQNQALGKTPGKDAQQNKPTYVSMLGIEVAHQLVLELFERAQKVLQQIPAQYNASYLQHLAHLIVMRTY